MSLPSKDQIANAREVVYRAMSATPCYQWPLLNKATDVDLFVKHENHTPTGAFKIRGGLTFFDHVVREMPHIKRVVTATRGNHGQSVARAAKVAGIHPTILVPHGNSLEKNAAMEAFGAELIVHGDDFQESRERAGEMASAEDTLMIPPFHPWLIEGVATYGAELFEQAHDLDAVYVPIGMGSGFCGLAAARAACGASTEIIGVVSTGAPAYKLSVEAGYVIEHEVTTELADGMACRSPDAEALGYVMAHAARIVAVSDDEIAAAIRLYFTACHQVAEGAGAAPLAALMQERDMMHGKKVAVILCGGNIDTPVYRRILGGSHEGA